MNNAHVAQAHDRELSFDEFQRIFGPHRALSPTQARDLFAGAPFAWWIAGGWSTEFEAEPQRTHEDLEVGIARSDLAAVREWLSDYHLWDVHEGALRFLWPETSVPDDHEQLWVRRDGYSPWLMDLMLTPIERGTWFYKRDRRLTRPMDELFVVRDGVPYQRPEITLLYKARRREEKDEQDFERIVPLLSAEDRAWLRAAIELTQPAGNPWVRRL